MKKPLVTTSAVLSVLGMSAFEANAASLNQITASDNFSGTREDLATIKLSQWTQENVGDAGDGSGGDDSSNHSCSSDPYAEGCEPAAVCYAVEHYRDLTEPSSGGEACRCKLVDFSYLGTSPSINIDFNIDLIDGVTNQTRDVIIWASTHTWPRLSSNGGSSSSGGSGGSYSSSAGINCDGWYSEHPALEAWLLEGGTDLNGDALIDAADWEIMRQEHWHHLDSFYEVFAPFDQWVGEDLDADADVDYEDWLVYKESHLHHAVDEQIRNLFHEEYYTWEYVLNSYDTYNEAVSEFQTLLEAADAAGLAMPDSQANMGLFLDWVENDEIKQLLMDFFLNGALEVQFCRTSDCPFYWTLFNEDGDEVTSNNDPFIRHFDGVHRVLSFGNDSEDLTGTRTYTLCANSNWNGDTSCVDLIFNVTVTSSE